MKKILLVLAIILSTFLVELKWDNDGGVVTSITTTAYAQCNPNGCGSDEFPVPNRLLNWVDWQGCCDNHDCCWADCAQPRATCDGNLGSCIKSRCEAALPAGSFKLRICLKFASDYQAAVSSSLLTAHFNAVRDAACAIAGGGPDPLGGDCAGPTFPTGTCPNGPGNNDASSCGYMIPPPEFGGFVINPAPCHCAQTLDQGNKCLGYCGFCGINEIRCGGAAGSASCPTGWYCSRQNCCGYPLCLPLCNLGRVGE